MNCPRDNSLLESVKKGKLDVNVCSRCNGFSVLLGQEAAEALSRLLAHKIGRAESGVVSDRLPSPFTGIAMERFEYRGIALDYCNLTNSVWFDRGEYSQIFKSPEIVSKPTSTIDLEVDAWEVVNDVGTTFYALDVVGDLVTDILLGVDVL